MVIIVFRSFSHVEDMTSQDKLNNHTCVCTGHFSEAEVLQVGVFLLQHISRFFFLFFFLLSTLYGFTNLKRTKL